MNQHTEHFAYGYLDRWNEMPDTLSSLRDTSTYAPVFPMRVDVCVNYNQSSRHVRSQNEKWSEKIHTKINADNLLRTIFIYFFPFSLSFTVVLCYFVSVCVSPCVCYWCDVTFANKLQHVTATVSMNQMSSYSITHMRLWNFTNEIHVEIIFLVLSFPILVHKCCYSINESLHRHRERQRNGGKKNCERNRISINEIHSDNT